MQNYYVHYTYFQIQRPVPNLGYISKCRMGCSPVGKLRKLASS